jgi:hypothetical protein
MQHLILTFLLVVDAQAAVSAPPELLTDPAEAPAPVLEVLDDFESAITGVPAAVVEQPKPVEPAKPLVTSTSGPKLLVLDLADVGAGADTATSISSAVGAQAIKSYAGTVVTSQQLALALDAAGMQALMGCAAEKCMTDIAREVEAERVLGGSVAKVGDDLLITLLVVEVATGRRIASEQRKVPLYKEMYYYAAKELTAYALTGRATTDLVPMRVEATETDARVLVDGVDRGTAPMTFTIDPGNHEIRVESDGFASWRTMVLVEEGQPVLVHAELVADAFPLWPVALAVAGMSVLTASGAMGAGLFALELYDGSITGTPEALARSYKYGSPVDSLTLAERKVTVQGWQLAANVMWGVAGVLLVSAVLIETADVVLWAME